MYETVLLPTDGSDVAASAVDHAIDAARRHGATVHLLYVIDQRVENAAPGLAMGDVHQKLAAEGDRATSELAERVRDADLEVVTEIREGIPDETILRYVDECGADIVVMGSTGKSIRERERVGSVTDSLVRKAGVPVLSVPGV